MGEVSDEHTEVVSVVEWQPTKVEDAEQDVSDHDGVDDASDDYDDDEKVLHVDNICMSRRTAQIFPMLFSKLSTFSCSSLLQQLVCTSYYKVKPTPHDTKIF